MVIAILCGLWVSTAGAAACREASPQSTAESFEFIPSAQHQALIAALPVDARVNSIRIQRLAVFNPDNPDESGRWYRLANRVHNPTREGVILAQLLVAEGDPLQRAQLEESERLLRGLPFLYDATVRPWRICGDAVDLEVVTRDVWTITPRLSFSRAGGNNSINYGFSDTNFLGTGKHVVLLRDEDDDRSGTTVYYGDPAIRGSRWRGSLELTDNDDGHVYSTAVERPFYALDTRWAGGYEWLDSRFEDARWFRGERVEEFDHDFDRVRLWGGFSAGQIKTRSRRWLWGWEYEKHTFSASDDTDRPIAMLPEDREYSWPFIGYESVEDEFLELRKINNLARTEDFFVGQRLEWQLGWSDDAITNDGDRVGFRANYSNTLIAGEGMLWQADTNLDGFWDAQEEQFENLWWRVESRFHRSQSERWGFFARLRLDYTDGLTEDRQVRLGGDNGLRGYERNYQVGERSFLLNIEERYYSDLHLWNLVRVGGALFVDVGRAWYDDRSNNPNGGVLSNFGVGLRLASSRDQRGRIVHIDLAVPLEKGQGAEQQDDLQLLIKLRREF